MRQAKCFICQNLCLYLAGQDTFCDTYMRLHEAEDSLMIEAEAFGECHLKCLINSPWGEYWSRGIFRHLVSDRNYPVIGEIEGITILRNARTRMTFLLRENGWTTAIPDQHLRERVAVNNGFYLPVKQVFEVILPDKPDLVQEVREGLSNKKAYPLPKLIDKLGLQPYLFYPDAVQSGLLHFREANVPPEAISTHAEYNEFLPTRVVEFILAKIDIRPTILNLNNPS
ncbi:MAG TPA: hypothetical protein VHO69_15130 [Phototrophicaceae bacterium]|nr:hypothetical protein [Phototrophicaceae bacterium]